MELTTKFNIAFAVMFVVGVVLFVCSAMFSLTSWVFFAGVILALPGVFKVFAVYDRDMTYRRENRDYRHKGL